MMVFPPIFFCPTAPATPYTLLGWWPSLWEHCVVWPANVVFPMGLQCPSAPTVLPSGSLSSVWWLAQSIHISFFFFFFFFFKIYLFLYNEHAVSDTPREGTGSNYTCCEHHVDSGNWIHDLWKSSQCSESLSHLSTPKIQHSKMCFFPGTNDENLKIQMFQECSTKLMHVKH